MIRLPRLFVASLLVLPLSLVPSCAAPQKLESVMVLPSDTTLQGFGLQVHYKAYGSFVHPPETLDISNTVTWSSSSPQIISIDNTGIATYVQGCATNLLITATYTHKGSVMVGTATLTGMDPTCSH
jgi:hypothetical protein